MLRRTNEEWLELYKQQRASGLTMKEWCTANDVKLPTMVDRITRLRKLGLINEQKPAGGRYLPIRQTAKKTEASRQDIVQLNDIKGNPRSPLDAEPAITLRVNGVQMDISNHANPAVIGAALQAVSMIC